MNNDGGNAFPDSFAAPGMSLRDYFAAQALATMADRVMLDPVDIPRIALRAYQLADEMLKAREKQS